MNYSRIVMQTTSRTFSFCKTETLYPLSNSFPPPLSPCQPPFDLLCLGVRLLEIPYINRWNYTAFVLLWLVYFSECNVLKVCSCGSTCQNFLPFSRLNNIPFSSFAHLFIRSSTGEHSDRLLWIKLPWTRVHKISSRPRFRVSDTYPEVELLRKWWFFFFFTMLVNAWSVLGDNMMFWIVGRLPWEFEGQERSQGHIQFAKV